VYLNCDPDLQPVLGRVTNAGGKILLEKTNIGDGLGYMAHILDSEGNRVALHSMK
jgi:predicted enzyme related to lactoylglutathione lyase